jgi:uncharacterized membrane protein
VGDANSKLGHQQKTNEPTIRELVELALRFIISSIFLALAPYALYLMTTNPAKYQERIRLVFEAVRKSNPVLPFIPPKLAPLVTGASALSFALVSTVYTAFVVWIVVLAVAGLGFGMLMRHVRARRREKWVIIQK